MPILPKLTRWKTGIVRRPIAWWLVALLFAFSLAFLIKGEHSEVRKLQVSGASYYVDAIAGNDDNTGTDRGRPWKTLIKVNETTFHPGDRLLMKSGSVWSGQLSPKGSGAAGQSIVVDAYGGDALPVINAEGKFEDAVLLKNQEYWEIQHLEITNHGGAAGIHRGVHVDVDGGEYHHIYLRWLKVHDVSGIDSVKTNGGIIYTCEDGRKASRFVDLRIENNEISHVDRSGIFGWSDHWVRKKWYPTLGLIIRNNRLRDVGGDGIVAVAADGALIEHNVVGYANQRSEGYNVAIWPWSSDNTVVQFNEAYGTRGQRDGEGFDSDWNSRGTIIQYNYSHDNEGGFLLICNEGGDGSEDSTGNVGTIVRYNISVNDRTRGINLTGPVTNTKIYNNTIYVGRGYHVDLVQYADWDGWSRTTEFYNNIFYVEGYGRVAYGKLRNPDGSYVSAPGFGRSRNNRFDFNVYYGNIRPPEDAHALTSDPRLLNPGMEGAGRTVADNYRLRVDSAAVNSGLTMQGNGNHDFFGGTVPLCGGTDRGAAEVQVCSNMQ